MALSAQDGRLVRRNDDELLWIEPWGGPSRTRDVPCRHAG